MATKSVTTYYKVTPTEIIPAPSKKDEWLKEIQRGLKAGDFKVIRQTNELFNPEIKQQLKFFNGAVVEYYAIQSGEILEGEVPNDLKKRYRETLLSEALGYEVQLIDRTERRRKSTADFVKTQEWHDFLETLRETEFEPNGYEFPNSEEFAELEGKYGYEEAKRISREQLQHRVHAKLSTSE